METEKTVNSMSNTNGTGSDKERNLKSLKDEQQVRQRPGVIFGTNDVKGAFHSVEEIIANAVDEAREGFCNHIIVDVIRAAVRGEGDVIIIEDNGRGLPMDFNEEEGKYNWELALCTLYSSGKYDASQYGSSLGLNGLGLTATQYASAYMKVWSTYNGKTRYIEFSKGKPIGKMKVMDAIQEHSGTKIEFQVDKEVFPELEFKNLSADMFLIYLRRQAMLIAGLCIEFTHYELNASVKFLFEGGTKEYIDDMLETKMLKETAYFDDSATGTDSPQYPQEYTVNMTVAFNFTRGSEEDGSNIVGATELYHNGSFLFEGGTTATGFENGIVQAFTELGRDLGKIGKQEKFIYKDIGDILVCIGTTDAPGYRTWFKNQTKGAIMNPFIGASFRKFMYEKIRYWAEQNKDAAAKVLQEVVANKTAREEGAEVSKKIIRKLSSGIGFGSKPKGFRDCSTKIKSRRELYIVEGRSALGSVKLSCTPEFQAVMPLRGKIINCLKEKLTRVLKNDIIIDLFRVLQCGLEVESEYLPDLPKFDIEKLNWGKIIICTDADVDGMHIRCLVLTMFYVLAPSLLKAGKVYVAETPLFDISYGKEANFAYSDEERDKILKSYEDRGIPLKKVKVQRSKGLGENDPDMMYISTMNPETRKLIKIHYPESDEKVREYFNALLGDDLNTRRTLINEYFDSIDIQGE